MGSTAYTSNDENDVILNTCSRMPILQNDRTKFEILQMKEELQLQKAELQAKKKTRRFIQQIKYSFSYAMTIQKLLYH
jgi:hypothetical protein